MAFKVTKTILFVVLSVLLFYNTKAQSDCTSALMSLSPCLNYVTGNTSTPSTSCCLQLSTVVRSKPRCLCSLLGGGASSYGLNINQTLALSLPTNCNVQTPPISRCNGPTASPTTPDSASGSSNTTDTSEFPSGSKSVPSTDAVHIGGSNIREPSYVIGFVLFVTSYVVSTAAF